MTATTVKAIPENMPTLTPHIVCADALGAIEFYKRAFGATEETRLLTKDGKLMHAMLRIGDSPLMLMEENMDWGAPGPSILGGTPVTIHVAVTDVDAAFARAVKAGGTAKMPPADMFWGDRYGVLTDPYGHCWSMATHVRDVTPEEMQVAISEMGECADAVQ